MRQRITDMTIAADDRFGRNQGIINRFFDAFDHRAEEAVNQSLAIMARLLVDLLYVIDRRSFIMRPTVLSRKGNHKIAAAMMTNRPSAPKPKRGPLRHSLKLTRVQRRISRDHNHH